MARDTLIGLLLTAVARPHSRCLVARSKPVRQHLRYASRSSKSTDPLLHPREPPKISLHVGLDRNPEHRSAISKIPIPKGEKGEKFTPSVLARPLGLEEPPQPGQNSPFDRRSFSERKADFQSKEKALERRQVYLRTFFRPYFQEWKRTEHHKGKSFVSNERMFRRDKALWFPNIFGATLAKEGDGPDGGRDTTPVMVGKISVVAMFSSDYAREQVDSFISNANNPELKSLLDKSNGRLQLIDVNMQDNALKSLLLKLSRQNLRRLVPEDQWSRYFMIKLPRDVRKGLTDDIRDAIGLLNTQVGYVYLVDTDCKIRWAGSGPAWEGEVASLNAAARRLLDEESTIRSIKTSSLQQELAKKVQQGVPPEPLSAAST